MQILLAHQRYVSINFVRLTFILELYFDRHNYMHAMRDTPIRVLCQPCRRILKYANYIYKSIDKTFNHTFDVISQMFIV